MTVEPNTADLLGNFEFIHCADSRQFVGKRVVFSTQIKAEAVTQTAQLRLRGEDISTKRILYNEVKVNGTHDWKEYSLEAYVSQDVALFSYGLTFRSAGKLSMSAPKFVVVP